MVLTMINPNRLRQNRICTVPISTVNSRLATASRQKQNSANIIQAMARGILLRGAGCVALVDSGILRQGQKLRAV
ncbi:hypothetical protein GCM10007052_31890 [Halioglobus japonicus]|nr:hypothetical protein GCM10007052_31890 [Halioglobus japonicus]